MPSSVSVSCPRQPLHTQPVLVIFVRTTLQHESKKISAPNIVSPDPFKSGFTLLSIFPRIHGFSVGTQRCGAGALVGPLEAEKFAGDNPEPCCSPRHPQQCSLIQCSWDRYPAWNSFDKIHRRLRHKTANSRDLG